MELDAPESPSPPCLPLPPQSPPQARLSLATQTEQQAGKAGVWPGGRRGCSGGSGEQHSGKLILLMDRFEDVSDCEVDHSFFDSDFEEEVKKNVTTTKRNDETDNNEHVESEDKNVDHSDLNMKIKVVESDGTKEDIKVVKSDCTKEEREGKMTDLPKECTLENGVDQPENILSLLVSQNSENAGTSCRISAQSESMYEKNTRAPKVVKEHEDNYDTDEENSSDDSGNQRVKLKSSKSSNSAKINKKISTSSSSSSPYCSSDADCSDTDSDGSVSDSSCSFPKQKSMCKLGLLSPRPKSGRGIKSVEVKPKLGDYTEESEDTVTDVTPLSTPDISPIQSFELAASNDKKLKVKRQENVSQELYEPDLDHRCHQKALHDAVDLNHLLKAFLQLEKKEQALVLDHPSSGTRKNYSFSNDEVRRIDQENQRLLKELTKYSVKPRSKGVSVKKPSCPAPKMYHSAVNRQKEQQRIDRENLAFLKRLEAVKPTVGMKRTEQLMDYQRQKSYLSSAPTPRRGKSAISHHSPSRGASRASSHSASSTVSRRSERPVFDSSSGALQRLNPSKIPTAWL